MAIIVNVAPNVWDKTIIKDKIIIVPIVDFSTGFFLDASISFPFFYKKIW